MRCLGSFMQTADIGFYRSFLDGVGIQGASLCPLRQKRPCFADQHGVQCDYWLPGRTRQRKGTVSLVFTSVIVPIFMFSLCGWLTPYTSVRKYTIHIADTLKVGQERGVCLTDAARDTKDCMFFFTNVSLCPLCPSEFPDFFLRLFNLRMNLNHRKRLPNLLPRRMGLRPPKS